MNKELAIVISSCEKYKNFWSPFFYFFHKCWPDCPYKIYLATDIGSYANCEVVRGNCLSSWATNMINCLSKIQEERFIMLLDDFFLRNRIDSYVVNSYDQHMAEQNIGYIRLFPSPGPDKMWKLRDDLGVISVGQPHRLSLQTSMWNKNVFRKLLKDGENIWDTEKYGTQRSNFLQTEFLSVFRKEPMTEVMFSYVMGARLGKWTNEAMEYCKNENLNVEFTI